MKIHTRTHAHTHTHTHTHTYRGTHIYKVRTNQATNPCMCIWNPPRFLDQYLTRCELILVAKVYLMKHQSFAMKYLVNLVYELELKKMGIWLKQVDKI